MSKLLINPGATEKIYHAMQFSQAIQVGETIWCSGQVGLEKGNQPAEGLEAQARIAFTNLKKVLESAGARMSDIVELVTYHTSMKDIMAFSRVKSDFIPEDFPAWTAVGVTELLIPGLLVEIRATAVVGCGMG
jgi:enamine deaminase RidA (YjgF/YER057c/UK114 family)